MGEIMKLDRAQKIIESVAKEERNFAYGDWDRDEAICTVLVEIQKKLRDMATAPAADTEPKTDKQQ